MVAATAAAAAVPVIVFDFSSMMCPFRCCHCIWYCHFDHSRPFFFFIRSLYHSSILQRYRFTFTCWRFFFLLGNPPSVIWFALSNNNKKNKFTSKMNVETNNVKKKQTKKVENRTHKTVTHANFYRWQNCVLKRERDWHRYRPKNRNKQTKWESCAFVALWEHN